MLLDRKPVGETPLKVDVPPGRHALTFLTSGGEVVQSVRVTAGKETPSTFRCSPAGSPSSRRSSSMSPRKASHRHDRAEPPDAAARPPQAHADQQGTGYSQTQEVDIEPGEVKTVNVDPKGTVSLNAVPWAEVWLDGAKLGDTPLAGTPVPLGTREFVFKNPQFGEKRATIKVRATPPTTSDDFSK